MKDFTLAPLGHAQTQRPQLSPNAPEAHALAGHVEDSSASQQPQSSFVSGQPFVARAAAVRRQIDGDEQKASAESSTSALGHQGIQTARAAALVGPPGHSESLTEEEQLLNRNEIIRRLSQSVLALSGNTLTRITDEHSPGVSYHSDLQQMDESAAAGRENSSTSPAAASEKFDIDEPHNGDGANDAPSSAKQRSPDGGQATQVTRLPWPVRP